jgi:hypothetical protein
MSAISLVTPTYWRDRDLCAMLCESVDRHLSSYVKHYLIVADEELPLFKGFNGARRVVVPSSQLLPAWLKPLPRFVQRKSRRYWWSLRAAPISGWHVQQILKIAAASQFPEERCCILDSDVVFFRRFDLSALQRPNPAPLYTVPREVTADAQLHAPWVRSSHRLLGLDEPAFPAPDFIGHIITWDRLAVRAMIERIETVTGLEWVEALCRMRNFSEYMLYGFFVQNSLRHMPQHFATERQQCLSYWGTDALDRSAIERMLGEAGEDYVALSAASISGTPVDVTRASLEKFTQMQRQVA